MLLNLKLLPQEHITLTLTERLPEHITAPCQITAKVNVKDLSEYYQIHLEVTGNLLITCERCLDTFTHVYHNITTLAAYIREVDAENSTIDEEIVIVNNNYLDLDAVITDELHLYSPAIHPNLLECNAEVSQYISHTEDC